ncbi:MAG: O-antigen ligase family protein [Xenococcus sp. (in: cyanobacteria)]
MKELIKDPLILLIIAFVGLVFLLLAFQYATKSKNAELLEKMVVIGALFLMTNPTIQPLPLLHPNGIAAKEASIISFLSRIVPYSAVVFILKYRYIKILQSTLMLFVLDPALAVLQVIVLLSFTWSETPSYSLRGAIVQVGLTIFSAYIAQRYSWHEISKFIRFSLGIVAVLSLLYSLGVPSVGRGGKGWRGILPSENPLSSLMGLSGGLWLFEAYVNPQNRRLAIGIFLISILIVQNANSAGGKVQLLALLASILWLSFLKRLNFKLALTGVMILMIFVISGTIIFVENTETIVVDILGKDMTLNGRIPLWTNLMGAVAKSPFLGYGYHGFWQGWRGEDNPAAPYGNNGHGWVAPHAHNGFIEILLYTGIVGFILFAISFFKTIVFGVIYLIRSESQESVLPLAMMTILVVSNISLSQLMDIHPMWIYYSMITVRLSVDIAKNQNSS